MHSGAVEPQNLRIHGIVDDQRQRVSIEQQPLRFLAFTYTGDVAEGDANQLPQGRHRNMQVQAAIRPCCDGKFHLRRLAAANDFGQGHQDLVHGGRRNHVRQGLPQHFVSLTAEDLRGAGVKAEDLKIATCCLAGRENDQPFACRVIDRIEQIGPLVTLAGVDQQIEMAVLPFHRQGQEFERADEAIANVDRRGEHGRRSANGVVHNPRYCVAQGYRADLRNQGHGLTRK